MTMTIVKCDVCEVEWNPREQSHKRGQDCASGLKARIDGLYASFQKLHMALQDIAGAESAKEEAVIKAFEDQRNQIVVLTDRFEALARRITNLESPNMTKMRVKGEKYAGEKPGNGK